jgi:hypothetical protein
MEGLKGLEMSSIFLLTAVIQFALMIGDNAFFFKADTINFRLFMPKKNAQKKTNAARWDVYYFITHGGHGLSLPVQSDRGFIDKTSSEYATKPVYTLYIHRRML